MDPRSIVTALTEMQRAPRPVPGDLFAIEGDSAALFVERVNAFRKANPEALSWGGPQYAGGGSYISFWFLPDDTTERDAFIADLRAKHIADDDGIDFDGI